jgi:hypothetical protein
LITWYVGTITGSQISQVQWGDFDTDFIVPAGDYDGDHKADYMVWRGFGTVNGVWYLRTSAWRHILHPVWLGKWCRSEPRHRSSKR